MSDSFILATSAQDAIVATIPLIGGEVQTVLTGLGVGLVPAVEDLLGVCGANNSPFLKLIDLSVDPPVLLGAPANAESAFVTTIGISVFASPGTPGGSGGGGAGGRGAGGAGGGGSSDRPGAVPTHVGGGDNLTRPVGLRAIIVAAGLKPERGLRIIRPAIVSVFEFAVRSFEEIVHYTE